jgi:hypothetical protein
LVSEAAANTVGEEPATADGDEVALEDEDVTPAWPLVAEDVEELLLPQPAINAAPAMASATPRQVWTRAVRRPPDRLPRALRVLTLVAHSAMI